MLRPPTIQRHINAIGYLISGHTMPSSSGKKRSSSGGGSSSAERPSKPKKRSRQHKKSSASNPTRLFDNESIDLVASSGGPIRTTILSSDDKDIVLDRLRKEIVSKFDFTLSKRRVKDTSVVIGGSTVTDQGGDDDVKSTSNRKRKRRDQSERTPSEPAIADVVKERLIVGTNQCTRALEAAMAAASSTGNHDDANVLLPSLVLLSRDVRPPTTLAHIPFLCQKLQIPAVVLPGKASSELGEALGGNFVAVTLFLPPSEIHVAGTLNESSIRDCHRSIDSYVKFVQSKIPKNNK